MTLSQVLKQSGKFYKYQDASKIGHLIATAATEKNIKWDKVEEMVTVNDYPEDFEEEMKRIAEEYFQRKAEITKRVMAEMNLAKPKPEQSVKIPVKERKRIPVKSKTKKP